MAEFRLRPGFASGLPAPGRHGKADGTAGIVARFRQDRAILVVEAGKGRRPAAAAALASVFGTAAPEPGRAALLGEGRLLAWHGPKSWLVIEEPGAPTLAALAAALSGLAALIAQSDGRILLEIGGPKAREVLARGTNIDLHPRVFAPGATALSHVGHVNAQIVQTGVEAYLLVVPRATAGSLGHWLEVSAASFGLDVQPPI